MDFKKTLIIFILFMAAGAGFCEQKAKVLTATGKKWDVLFIRMHNDTVYLQVSKANGRPMSVSGHKTKFKKIELSDGTIIDLSLSNYPAEHDIKLSGDIGDWPGPSTYLGEAPPPLSSELSVSKKTTFSQDSIALDALAARTEKEPRPDSSAGIKFPSDDIAPTFSKEKTDSTGGAIIVNTKPSLASIILDGKPIEATTPYTISHLAPGKHGIKVIKDSLYAFTVVTVKEHKTANVTLHLKKPAIEKAAPAEKKKNHALAWSLCLSSVVILAGSAASYYFALDDQKKALDARDFLDKSLVPGPNYQENLEINKQKSDAARLETNISSILLGIGALDLGLGIVFFF